MSYSGYEISVADRAKLASIFPPKFTDFIGHHVTWQFGVDERSGELPPQGTLKVVGYACDDSLECLVVEVNGSIRRPDRQTLHVTWSLERAAGRKPVDSNQVLKAGYQAVRPINIDIAPKFFKRES